MPLHRRGPKLKGFNNPFRVEYQAINLDVLDALGLEQVVLVGNSMGAPVSLEVAHSAPERVAGIVLNDIGPEADPRGIERIRGVDADNPVLLFLAGGPGGAELGTMRRFGGLLEQDFVVVTREQRGTAASYDAFEPVSTLTIHQAVDHTFA